MVDGRFKVTGCSEVIPGEFEYDSYVLDSEAQIPYPMLPVSS